MTMLEGFQVSDTEGVSTKADPTPLSCGGMVDKKMPLPPIP